MSLKEKRILIVGAGCFGVSTAYHLLQRGYQHITIIDRSEVLPAPDAASTDLNKVIRSAYEDPFYCKLAREAIKEWKKTDIWGDAYHESGFILIRTENTPYGDASLRNDIAEGAQVRQLASKSEIEQCFPLGVEIGDLVTGYPPVTLNMDGGWAAAADGVATALGIVKELGAKIIPGKTVTRILRDGGETTGVGCADGCIISADVVVIATGSWTGGSFLEEAFHNKVFAAGQGVATIQLSQKDADRYRNCPVVLDRISGFYIFPPNKDNVVKFSAHGAGYTHTSSTPSNVSIPRTLLSNGTDGLRIPKDMVLQFREVLRRIYPELGNMDFQSTRFCWYTYTSDSDWIIDEVDDSSVFVATGGSGHGFKFLPVIGRLIADRIENVLPPDLVEKFSIRRDRGPFKNWGWFSEPRELDVGSLCDDRDLVAN